MKPILLLYAFSSLSSASLSPDFSLNLHALAPRADDILRIADHFLPKRADEEKNTAESTESTDTATASATETDTKTGTASDSTITDAPKTTDTDTDTNSDTNTDETKTGTDTGTGTETGTDTDTDTDTDTGKHKNKKPHKTTSISIDPAAGPGGISMLTPAATAGETFVKVGTNVTFAWNYTSLTITPSGIDVLAWNGQASRAYTITHNATVHKTQTVIWDTKDYMQTAESNPIVNGKYTLMVYDSKHGPSHIADAGHLGAYTQYTFGVYTPQSYTPWSSWKCDSCSGALSDVQRQSLKFVLAMAGLTVFSFGWFINGLGLL